MLDVSQRLHKPNVIVLHNENPDWPQSDKDWAMKFVEMLTGGLQDEGYVVKPVKFFDDLSALDLYDPRQWLIWNWGEEMAGESWTEPLVAAELDRRGFAYTGASTEVLKFSNNRLDVKQRLRDSGLPTLPAQVFTTPEQAAREWTIFPAIVKGANQHASFGISGDSIAHNPDQLAKRVAYMRSEYNDNSLVEQFLDSREFQVAVWGNGKPEVLPPVEFDYSAFSDMRDRLYTFEWKFDRTSRGYREIKMPCPAPADKPLWRERLEKTALEAYKVIGLRDYGRIDMRMLGDEPQVLDVNPNPDLDHISVLYTGAKLQGLNYGQMASCILDWASARMPK
jgi:D-alanine-D-alanine ligase